MPKIAGLPLHKITLNLYEEDIKALAHSYGYGWSEIVRELVHEHLKQKRSRHTITIEDIVRNGQ